MSGTQRRKSSCYCINLRRAANSVAQLYDRFLDPIGLSVGQYSLLVNLSRLETASVSDLAVYVGLDRSTLARTLRPLLEQGLIADSAGTGKRSKCLQLTEAGMQSLERGRPLWQAAQEAVEVRIGRAGVRQLNDLMEQLIN